MSEEKLPTFTRYLKDLYKRFSYENFKNHS